MTCVIRNQTGICFNRNLFYKLLQESLEQESVLYILCGRGKEGWEGAERYHMTRLIYHIPLLLLATYHLVFTRFFVRYYRSLSIFAISLATFFQLTTIARLHVNFHIFHRSTAHLPFHSFHLKTAPT